MVSRILVLGSIPVARFGKSARSDMRRNGRAHDECPRVLAA